MKGLIRSAQFGLWCWLLWMVFVAAGVQPACSEEIIAAGQRGPVVVESIIFSVREDKERIALKTDHEISAYNVITDRDKNEVLIVLPRAVIAHQLNQFQPGLQSVAQVEFVSNPNADGEAHSADIRLTLQEDVIFHIRRTVSHPGLEIIFALEGKARTLANGALKENRPSISKIQRVSIHKDAAEGPAKLALASGTSPTYSIGLLPLLLTSPQKDRTKKTPVSAAQAEVGKQEAAQVEGELQAFTLDQLIDLALKNNPGIASSRREIAVAEQELKIAKRQRFPRVDIEASALSTLGLNKKRLIPRVLIRGIAPMDHFHDNIFDIGAKLIFPVYTGGRIPAQIEIGELSTEIAEDRFKQTWSDLIFNVSSAYFSILKLERLVGAIEGSIEALSESQRVARLQLEVGKIADVDLFKVNTRLAEVQQALIKIQNAEALARADLNALLGEEDIGERIDLVDRLAYKPLPIDLQASIEQALRQRPEYLARTKELQRQRQRVRLASSERLPNVRFSSRYLRTSGDSDFARIEQDASVELNVSFPIFDGGVIRSKIDRERSKAQQLEEQLRDLKLSIMLEVKNAGLNTREAESRIKTAQAVLQQADEALRVERLKLDVGKSTIEFLLDAQAAQLRSHVNHIEALADYNIALAALRRAVGDMNP